MTAAIKPSLPSGIVASGFLLDQLFRPHLFDQIGNRLAFAEDWQGAMGLVVEGVFPVDAQGVVHGCARRDLSLH